MSRIELDNRRKAAKALRALGWDVMPVENKASSGTPDLNAARRNVEIWIEFKIVERWPKRATTPVKIDHFTPAQRSWFNIRVVQNQNCFIIVQIEKRHFLFRATPPVIASLGVALPEKSFYDQCLAHSESQFELLKGITDEV